MHQPPLLVSLLASLASAGRDTGRPGYGLIGYGIDMYIPVCAYACQYSFGSNPLVCTDETSFSAPGMDGMGGMDMGGNGDGTVLPQNVSAMPSSTCHAESRPFLTPWQSYAVENSQSDPPPSLSYGATLALVPSKPNVTCSTGQILNATSLVNETLYHSQYVSIDVNQNVEIQHERFGLFIFLSGVVIPVGFSLLRFLPFPKRWTIATLVSDPPTRGQALFIGYLVLLNVFLSAFKYDTHPTGFGYWWNDGPDEIMGDLANQLGVLSFANFALLVLYSSRNNLLLWSTNWQHSAFILLHRWVARIAVLQAILHSLVFLYDWIQEDRLMTGQVLPYWWWGCIATIAASLLLPLSIPLLRQRRYELFLGIHIVASILIFLDWRFWENHPFSIASSVIHQNDSNLNKKDIPLSKDVKLDAEKSAQTTVRDCDHTVEIGMVFYLRILDGGTKALRYKTQLPVLIEGIYGTHEDLSDYPTLVCIAGGVGVTSVLPYMRAHLGSISLYWGSRTQALVDSMLPLTQGFSVEIAVGRRLDLRSILESQHGDFVIVVSGPPSMMDETREIVTNLALKRRVKLIVESFTYLLSPCCFYV
ncbi:ferric reductase like transmembrane component-domain-containing protein [Daldinia sp. FL1419]|nr:ferric reductase like transmembrane component-domain-containing protein [Daldinia sp. FL1419]